MSEIVTVTRTHTATMNRRALLQRTTALGLTAGTGILLAACGGSGNTPAATAGAQATKAPVATTTSASAVAGIAPTVATSGAAMTNVRMACWSQPISEQANIYGAQENGWFTAQGLDFTFVPGAGGGDALKNILAGNAEFAFTNVEPLLFAIQEGAKLRAVYNIYPQNVFNLLTLKTSGLTSVAALKGKKVGVYSQSSGTRYNLLVMLKNAGLKESDVEVVAAGIANFGPLADGKVDATAATDTGLYGAQQAGMRDLNVLWARDVLNTPSDIFVVTEDVYQKKKDLIPRFLKAYKQGAQWMLDKPDAAAELAVKYATDGKEVARNRAIIEIRNASTVSDATKANGLGFFDMDLLKKVDATFSDLGITKQHFEMEKIFTNEFLAAT
ncbi:MAG: ABC transporter substrate-binding protein [Chloroflexota bacterium]|nr:ABC transporter substrate-binding protein [Chloroflexota bacterium]